MQPNFIHSEKPFYKFVKILINHHQVGWKVVGGENWLMSIWSVVNILFNGSVANISADRESHGRRLI